MDVRRWAVPTAAVAACTAAALLLTQGLDGGTPSPAAPLPSVAVSADAGALAPGPLADLLPTDAEWGTGWVSDDSAASQQVTDGPGLLRPCGTPYPSDAQRLELVRRNVLQDLREVPAGSAMTFELARYAPGGAQQAVAERTERLAACAGYRTTFAGLPDTPVDVGLLNAPAGGDGAAAHLAVTADTSVGRQAVEYTYLVARQGDVLLSAVVGNGNGSGTDLDEFARGYFQIARQKLAGQELAGVAPPSPEVSGA